MCIEIEGLARGGVGRGDPVIRALSAECDQVKLALDQAIDRSPDLPAGCRTRIFLRLLPLSSLPEGREAQAGTGARANPFFVIPAGAKSSGGINNRQRLINSPSPGDNSIARPGIALITGELNKIAAGFLSPYGKQAGGAAPRTGAPGIFASDETVRAKSAEYLSRYTTFQSPTVFIRP